MLEFSFKYDHIHVGTGLQNDSCVEVKHSF